MKRTGAQKSQMIVIDQWKHFQFFLFESLNSSTWLYFWELFSKLIPEMHLTRIQDEGLYAGLFNFKWAFYKDPNMAEHDGWKRIAEYVTEWMKALVITRILTPAEVHCLVFEIWPIENAYDQLTNYLEKLGYFSNPPKKPCSNFFGLRRTSFWSN